jgi:hypothetical protein
MSDRIDAALETNVAPAIYFIALIPGFFSIQNSLRASFKPAAPSLLKQIYGTPHRRYC